MRKLGVVAAAAALATIVAMISPVAGTVAQEGGARTLKFSATYSESQQTEVDADGDGDLAAGDYFVGNFVLRRGGRARGHLEFRCDIVTAKPERELCHGVAHIDGQGEITVADVSSAARNSEKVAITGGTGTFGGASGNGVFKFGRTRASFTFTVR